MITFNNKTQEEINRLIEIGKKYRDSVLSESLLSDVLQSLKNDPETMEKTKKFLLSQGIKVVPSFFDIEEMEDDEPDDTENQIKPYDPSQIDISPKNQSLDLLLNRVENEEIDLMPDFQRKAGLWAPKQKSQLIESLILRIPLPAFYFDGTDNDKWIVIDGLQRLTALKEFFIDKTLRLTGLEFLKDLEGLGCDDMPKVYLRRMKETQVICYIINPGAPINLKYNIFKRINTGGLHLEPQEIRHALYQGFATQYLKKLSDNDTFKRVTGYSVPTDRMMDREFVLRIIEFYELRVDKYDAIVDDILNAAMALINKKYKNDPTYAADLEQKFLFVLETSEKIFGRFAFRRMPDTEKRRTMSKALFETWTVVLAKHSNEELDKLVLKREYLVEKYMPMFTEDEEFYNSIGSGKIYSVRKRFEKIERLVAEVLNYA